MGYLNGVMRAPLGHVVIMSGTSTDAPERVRSRLELDPLRTVTTAEWSLPCLQEALQNYVERYARDRGLQLPPAYRVAVSQTDRPSGIVYTFSLVPGVAEGTAPNALSGGEQAALGAALASVPLPEYIYNNATQSVLTVFTHCVTKPTTSEELSNGNTKSESHVALPLLMVGAGGIGCELLKVLVLMGFRCIHVVDLDTIDASNLNRQFLFETEDIGASKAVTARQSVLRWYEGLSERFPLHSPRLPPKIVAHHDNIKDGKYDLCFYQQFAAVLNALDNVSARQHVNRMCMLSGIPLIESGTMGYNGQVQPIMKGVSECYSCQPKPADTKTFAVCTIHARPTTMVHCTHYAKELYETLFGSHAAARAERQRCVPNAAGPHLALNNPSSPIGEELAYLHDLIDSRRAVGDESASLYHQLELGTQLLECLFRTKVEELLRMKTQWPSQPPTSLEASLLPDLSTRQAPPTRGEAEAISKDVVLSASEYVELFLAATAQCAERRECVPFQKEDDAAVLFVAAAANLRAHVFHIPKQSVEDIKGIAGAIVPAITTTNAMVAACVAQQLICVLSQRDEGSGCREQETGAGGPPRMVYVRKAPQIRRRRPRLHSPLYLNLLSGGASLAASNERGSVVIDYYLLHETALSAPRPECTVCQSVIPTVTVMVDMSETTLHTFVSALLIERLGMASPSIMLGSSVVYETDDYEDLGDHLLTHFLDHSNSMSNTASEAVGVELVLHESVMKLLLVVDAMNHNTEWHVVVRHDAKATPHAAQIDGVEAARAAEALASARCYQNDPTPSKGGSADGEGASGGQNACSVIELGSSDEDGDGDGTEEVVLVD